ncbi:MAG: short-chain dehydrogenase [Patescibacteria group bacterium]
MTESTDTYLGSITAFHLQMPLYRTYDLAIGSIKEKVYELMIAQQTVDAYCIWCRKQSVFQTHSPTRWTYAQWQKHIEGELTEFNLQCVHNQKHIYRSYYFLTKGTNDFQKVGQFPSAADFQIPQSEIYRKILTDQQFKEMVRGIGLAAHGVGIGSFVYLRRVFEDLIEEAHEIARVSPSFDEKTYADARMDDKIKMLEEHLPSFLVENRKLYSVLSKGIHDLTEEECLAYFDAVRIGIEQILDEKIELQEKAEKAARAKAAVQDLLQKTTN